MKKRILSCLMALALCLTLLPTAALAEGTAENVAEVTISDGTTTQHTDIVAAFTAAQEAASATVKLLKNVTIPQNADSHSYGIRLKSGDITLDLNGCTIQTTGGESGFVPLYAVFYIENGSSLTVQDSGNDGKIVQPNAGQAIGVSSGNLTVKSGTIEVMSTVTKQDGPTTQNCAVFVRGNGVADIQGGTLIGNRGIYVGGEWGGGTLTVSGGTIHGKNSYALWVVGGSAALSGGSYTTGVSDGYSIYNSADTAAALLASGYRYQDDNGKESAYSSDENGVVGNTTVAVRPANEFSYVDANGKEQTQAGCTELTAAGFEGALAGEETWFAANTDITADDLLQVRGTVNLILCDGVTVTLNKGIALNGQYTQPATLNIYAQSGGTGTLICSGPSDSGCAGIYDNSNGDAHEAVLNIYGGVITATGTSNPFSPICGAGIGSIGSYKYKSTMAVNISGGTVTAKSGGEGAQAIGNGTNPKGTVTVKIAPGMKCVRTDDPNTACDPGNTNGTSVTVTKCEDHVWKYDIKDNMHTKTCTLCNADGGSETHKAEKYVSADGSQHNVVCVCGKTIATAPHDMQCTPNADGLTHKTSCNRCGWTSADEKHTFGENGACVCGIEKSAEYGGQEYASLQAAVNAAAKAADGGTVTLARDVSENATVTGGTLTVDLNRKTWLADISENPDIWGRIPLTVTGGSVTLENGTLDQGRTTSAGSYGIRIQGGSVTVKGNAVVIGSNTTGSEANISYPAIRLESGGTLTLETGAALVYGLEVPEGKQLKDYLPEGTAFRLRSYDESTGTWTEDKGLLNAYTINNYAEHNMALVVVEHTKHDFKRGSDGKYVCACGYTCPHNEFENGVCKICGNGCAHTDVDDGGVCRNCKTQMAVKSETGGTVTYGTDFKAAMNNTTNGTKITLLADVSISNRTGISGDDTTVTLDLNGHKITSGWLDVGNGKSPTACTLKIIGKGSYEPPLYGGIITVNMKATLDLSEWEGGTISSINISDSSDYEAETREAAVIVGPNAGTIGKLTFGNNQLDKLKKTKLSGGSFNEIWAANHQPVKLGELLADGYAFQNGDGSYVEYGRTLQNASIYNVKVVKCLHPNMKPDAATGMATCEYCGKSGNFVASVDGNLYTDMKEAITYWLANGGTLKLYADYTATDGTWSIGSGLHTINLNGHKMSVKGDGAFKPTNNMHLTVTDGKEIGQIENILLDGNQGGSFTLESGYVGNLEMTGGAVIALKGGSVDKLDVQNSSANTNFSIQGGSIGKLNIKDWADGMHVSATSGSLGAYNLPSGKILADVLDHQYYAEGTSLDRQVDTAQKWEQFVIKQAPHDFGSTSKVADVPINGRIPFMVGSPSENVGVYEVKWYRRTNSGAEHMTENKVADVNVNDKLDVFCVITGLDRPNNGTVLWQVAVKGYKLTVTPADLSQGAVVFTQVADEFGAMGNIGDGKGTFVFTPWDGNTDHATELSYLFKVSCNGRTLTAGSDYTVTGGDKAVYAGTYTLTIEGKGNYTGTAAHQWEIKPYTLSKDLGFDRIVRDYDGMTNLSAEELIELGRFLENLENRNSKNPSLGTDQSRLTIRLGAEDFEVSNVKLGSAEAGDTTASFTIKLKPRPGQTAANFVFEDGTSEMTVKEVPVSTRKAFPPSPLEARELNVANDHAGVYTLDLAALLPKLESPKEYGNVTYKLGTVSINGGYYDAAKGSAEVKDGKLILPIQAVAAEATGKIGTVTVKVTSGNIVDFDLTINVNATNKIVPTGTPTLSKNTLAWGEQLSTITLSGTMTDPTDSTKTVKGKFEWVAPGAAKEKIGEYEAAWKFTPDENAVYTEAAGTVTITVTKATPKGAPDYTKITTTGKTLKDANLTAGTIQPEGTIQWEQGDKTVVTANTAYKWVFTPKDTEHYDVLTGSITPYSVSSNTGGSSGGGSSSDRDSSDSNPIIKTETKNNADGSTTKTETRKDGTVTQTTTAKDGSTSKTETKKDGSSVTENKAADGSTGTVKTGKNGQTEAKTALSNKAIEDAKKNGEAVKAPVEVEASRDSSTAPTVKVELPKGAGETKVEIPVSNVKPGTVAVLVHPDGTEEIVKNSIPTEDGIQLTVDGNATVKIIDNSKDFIDTRNHWAEDAIDFVSARGLVNGMTATIYAPNNSTTRAQLWTILARQNDADLSGGSVWYEKAQNWAKAKGISDGANPNAAINRAQMVTMLWRAVGQPTAGSAASFTDVSADSYYAGAVSWAVENGITTGVGGGRFDPAATCTRAQIAAFLARLYAEK